MVSMSDSANVAVSVKCFDPDCDEEIVRIERYHVGSGRGGNERPMESNATHEEKDTPLHHWTDFLSNRQDGVPDDIYWPAAPIWCGYSHDDLAERLGEEYACGFAYGFERGIIMAMLRPEWAQGVYFELREHYAATHTEEDLQSWERHADQTARAISIERTSHGLEGVTSSR